MTALRLHGRTPAFFGLFLVSGTLAIACGSTAVSDVFPAGAPSGTVDGGSLAVDAASLDSGSATTSHDSGPAAVDSGNPTVKDAGVPDSSTGPTMLCSPESGGTCKLGSEVCCLDDQGTPSCSGLNDCNGLPVPCATAADCADGKVCCATVNNGGIVVSVACQAANRCTQGLSRVIVCDPNDPNACASSSMGPGGQASCRMSSDTLPGFNLCF